MKRPLNVLLGISGSIAAVKSPEIVRLLRGRGHQVRCVFTPSASAFVQPLPLEVLSGHAVYREEYLAANHSGEELHITAASWADVLCIAPTTCNTLARLALGLAGDFLSTIVLAYEGPVVLAPAMSSEMWAKPIVQRHVRSLVGRGVTLIGPVSGPLASGQVGMGRMAEPEQIVTAIESSTRKTDLAGQSILITAGPTREPIDPVRFLSNRSSGRMGFSLAIEAATRGAQVVLVAGPVALTPPAGVETIFVETAREMADVVRQRVPDMDAVIMTAAVADFRPTQAATRKLKKTDGIPELVLEPNPDILAELAAWAPQAVRVGFAAEIGNPEAEARRKLADKRAHFIVANDVSRRDIGIGSEDNEVIIFGRHREPVGISRRSKREVAAGILDLLVEALNERAAQLVSSGG